MKIAILGASGQLGSLLCKSAPAHAEVSAYGSRELDIRDAEAVAATLRKANPDVVINAAAYTQVDKAEAEPERAFAVNHAGLANLVAGTANTTRLIHISTDFVFDGKASFPYKPESVCNPLGVYGQSKLAGERELMTQAPQRSCILRTAWLYAAQGRNFVNTMLELLQKRDTLSVVADQKGTPTSAHTLAEVIWRFASLPQLTGIFHWTDGGEASWFEFACEIQRLGMHYGLLKRAIPIKPITTAEYPTPAKRPAYSVLDKTSTWAALGFKGHSWQAELDKVMQIKQTQKTGCNAV
jgi:dTDP-4-dehydrorhamnose reductase